MNTDQNLQADVLAELKWDPRVHSNAVGVIVKDGAVTLTGTVETYAEKLAAERATKRVKGVRAIAADIEVQLPAQMQTTDEGLAEQIARILNWNGPLRNTDIQAEVRNGHVTLTGEVDWSYQRQAAERRVEELQGVTCIVNQIRLRPHAEAASARDVQRQITSALHRHANVEAFKIRVSVADGKVTLDGTVDTYGERELVEDAAWATAGVKEVFDNLRVT